MRSIRETLEKAVEDVEGQQILALFSYLTISPWTIHHYAPRSFSLAKRGISECGALEAVAGLLHQMFSRTLLTSDDINCHYRLSLL
jgi:hypothetical protein